MEIPKILPALVITPEFEQRELLVVVVNWNAGFHQLEKTLRSISESARIAQLSKDIGKVVVHLWDNNSTDFCEPSTSEHASLHITLSVDNLGFAKANNLALTIAPCTEWILLLNPDAELSGNALKSAMQVATEHSDVAAFGFSMISADEPDIIDGLGDVVHISGLCWRDGFRKSRTLTHDLGAPYETFAVCAAALLIRRNVFAAIGGFDEDFFCYQEDVDLGFRLRLMGYRAIQIPDALVYHVGSQTTGGHRSDFSVYHGRRNLVWCYVKNMPGILFWLFLPLHLALNLVELIYFTYQGQGRVIWRAKWDAIKGLSKMWRKRQQIQAKRVATLGDIWHALDKRLWPWGFKSIRAKSGRRFGKD